MPMYCTGALTYNSHAPGLPWHPPSTCRAAPHACMRQALALHRTVVLIEKSDNHGTWLIHASDPPEQDDLPPSKGWYATAQIDPVVQLEIESAGLSLDELTEQIGGTPRILVGDKKKDPKEFMFGCFKKLKELLKQDNGKEPLVVYFNRPCAHFQPFVLRNRQGSSSAATGSRRAAPSKPVSTRKSASTTTRTLRLALMEGSRAQSIREKQHRGRLDRRKAEQVEKKKKFNTEDRFRITPFYFAQHGAWLRRHVPSDPSKPPTVYCLLCVKDASQKDALSKLDERVRRDQITKHSKKAKHKELLDNFLSKKGVENIQEHLPTDDVLTSVTKLVDLSYMGAKTAESRSFVTKARAWAHKHGLKVPPTAYNNWKFHDEVVFLVSTDLRNTQTSRLLQSPAISILGDASSSPNHEHEFEAIFVKYWCEERKLVVTELFDLVRLECEEESGKLNLSAEGVFKHYEKVFTERGLWEHLKKALVAVCFDGASVMMGKHKGLGRLFQGAFPHIYVFHAVAHRLELAFKSATSNCGFMKDMERITSIMKDIANEYRNSPQLWQKYERFVEDVLDKKPLRFVRMHGVRWMAAQHRIVRVFFTNWPSLVCELLGRGNDAVGISLNMGSETSEFIGVRVPMMVTLHDGTTKRKRLLIEECINEDDMAMLQKFKVMPCCRFLVQRACIELRSRGFYGVFRQGCQRKRGGAGPMLVFCVEQLCCARCCCVVDGGMVAWCGVEMGWHR